VGEDRPDGCRDLNTVLQEALNPSGPAIQRYGWTFRVGDKVMQIVNDYDKDVFNGDIGRMAKIDEVEQEVTVRFDDRPVQYDFNELDELHLSSESRVRRNVVRAGWPRLEIRSSRLCLSICRSVVDSST
jgi:exodeoxyribonuclease V alpha subunit